jgi:hypothetical protein
VYGDNLGLKGRFVEYAIAPEVVLARKHTALTFASVTAHLDGHTIYWRGRVYRCLTPGGKYSGSPAGRSSIVGVCRSSGT